MRRFELIEGNQAKFWEIVRKGDSITTRWGRISGSASTKTKSYEDFMAAEVEFDRQVRARLASGYVEVESASDAPDPIPARLLELRPVGGGDIEPMVLQPDATRYLVWRMIEIGIVNRFAEPPDLDRWAVRVTRRLRLDAQPAPGEPHYDEFFVQWLELSRSERAQTTGQFEMGAYKFISDSNWIVAPEECESIGTNIDGAVKRHKPTMAQRKWTKDFATFNALCAKSGGYEVVAL